MRIRTWLNRILKKEAQQDTSFPIYKIETPDKIIETKIQPVKVPTVFDVCERLSNLSQDMVVLKNEMVSRSWFVNEFEDKTPSIINVLNEINDNLNSLRNNFTEFTKTLSPKLSNFTKDTAMLTDINHFSMHLNTSEVLHEIIKKSKKIRYRDIKKQVPISDPTLSKYLKILVSKKKIRRTKVGKAVFYEPI